eukprot:2742259-Alexandrium_andersonii.AAC.1
MNRSCQASASRCAARHYNEDDLALPEEGVSARDAASGPVPEQGPEAQRQTAGETVGGWPPVRNIHACDGFMHGQAQNGVNV